MPKFYRQNRKRIDPRYFLNETTNRNLMEYLPGERGGIPSGLEIMSSLAQYKNLVCDNQRLFLIAINHLSPGLAAAAIIRKVESETGKDMPTGSKQALAAIIEIYQGNEKMKEPLRKAIDMGCEFKLPF